MAQCNWDPAKHNGKSCPVHGASGTENNTGHKLRINGGKYQVKYSDSSDYEDTDKETYEHLRETASQDFDENIEDDFGFDEEYESEYDDGKTPEQEYEDRLKIEKQKQLFNQYHDTLEGLSADKLDAFQEDLEYAEENGLLSEEQLDKLWEEVDKKIDENNKAIPGATTYNGAEVIGGDDDNEGMLKNKTPLSEEESKNLDPNNPKYEGFSRSHITNAKEVYDGGTVHNYDRNKDEKWSIIEYIPYGALQDGDNRKLYGIVTDYDGSDAPDTGAIVGVSLEDAKEQLQRQQQLAEEGSERYTKRGKWDENWFKMLFDDSYDWDEDTKSHYSQKYGWDFTKPWEEQEHMKAVKKKPNELKNFKFYGRPNMMESDGNHGKYQVKSGDLKDTKTYKAENLEQALDMLEKDYPNGFYVKHYDGPEGRKTYGQYDSDTWTIEEIKKALKKGK